MNAAFDPFKDDTDLDPPKIRTRLPEREADYRSAILNDVGLSADAVLLGVAMIHRFWQSGEVWASQSTLAAMMHIPASNRKRVRKACTELETTGYLDFVERLHDGRLRYRMTIPCEPLVSVGSLPNDEPPF